jgi:1-deoxy-D-xylulose-5-phosphate reductoisomerase
MTRTRPVDRQLGIAILGSTGSVGCQTLEVIDAHPERFRVVVLAARSVSPRLREQVRRYQPELVAISESLPDGTVDDVACVGGEGALLAAVLHPDVDIVVIATSGHAAIAPALRAIEQGKIVALANKETLVCAGELIMPLVSRSVAQLRPIDSEHSAIWQALCGQPNAPLERIILTASGGPFRATPPAALARVTAADALAHPTWRMGSKITVDSATLMNKGLEVIEAHWLFATPYDRIDVLVHPESIVHSLVEYSDGSQIAQLGLPDMRLPIQFALSYPDRLSSPGQRLDLAMVGALHFESPDEERFPALRLAREAGIAGRTYPTVLSVADEVAVAAFLAGTLRFNEIPRIVAATLDRHEPSDVSLEAIEEAVPWAEAAAREAVVRMH